MSSGPISSRVGMRKIAPALSALTFGMTNASGFVSRIASIMRWTLTESSGRSRVAIDHNVSDARTGPYSAPLEAGGDAGVEAEAPVPGASAGGAAGRPRRAPALLAAEASRSSYPRTAPPRGQSTSTRNVRDGSMIGSSVRTWMKPAPPLRSTTVNSRRSRCSSRATPASSNWAGDPRETFSPSRSPLRTPRSGIRASSGSCNADRVSITPSSNADASRGANTSMQTAHMASPCIMVVPRTTAPSPSRLTSGGRPIRTSRRLHPFPDHGSRTRPQSPWPRFNPFPAAGDGPSTASRRSARC